MNFTLTSLLILGFLASAAIGQFPESCACPDDCVCSLESGIISCDDQGLRHIPIELNSCSWPGIHTLNLSSNFIREIQEYSFSLLTNLTRLYIYENSIALIDRDAFVGLRSLEFLFLDGNRIASLPYQVFRPLRNLKKLLLYDNDMTTLPFGIFSQQAQLTTLALYSNRLTELKTEWFDDTPKLEELYLHDNRISDLSKAPFRSLHYVRILFLSDNLLTTLTGSDFLGLRRLTMLVLSNNRIASINNNVFLSTPELQRLYLEFNRLTDVNRLMFAPPVYLQQLRIYSNRISRISDGAFYRLRHLRLLSLYDNQLTTITPQTFVGLDSLDELVIHSNFITYIRNNTFSQSPLMQRLWMNNNRISCLESNAFNNLGNLALLNLGYNQLTSIPDGLFQNTPEILYLLLNSNQLSSIPNKPFQNLPKLLQLALISNPIEFIGEGCFSGSDRLYYFQFSRDGEDSSLRCDCSTLWLHEWMTDRPLLSSVLCGKPAQFSGQDIRTLQTASFGCEAAILTVEAGPDCDNHMVTQGSCLQLTCSSRPRGAITWSRADGRPIRTVPPSCSSTSTCQPSVSGDGSLVLDRVTPEDAGYYICTATFQNQTALQICRVSVAEPPVLNKEPDEVYLTYPGPSARFSLNFTGHPTPTVSWYHILPSGAEIHVKESGPLSRYLISDQGSLVILQTHLEDEGTYKAIISNGGGTVTTETQLSFFFESPCRSHCQNGGDCREFHQCTCPDFYEGRYCENFVGDPELTPEPPTPTTAANVPSSTQDALPNTQTPPSSTSSIPDNEVDESGSGSGFEYEFESSKKPSQNVGSGDLDMIGSGSGSGSGTGPGSDQLDKLDNDASDLIDDEDFDSLAVAGGARRRRRSTLSIFPFPQSANKKPRPSRPQHGRYDLVAEWYSIKSLHDDVVKPLPDDVIKSPPDDVIKPLPDDVIKSPPDDVIKPLPVESSETLEPDNFFYNFEYRDVKEDLVSQLKFER